MTINLNLFYLIGHQSHLLTNPMVHSYITPNLKLHIHTSMFKIIDCAFSQVDSFCKFFYTDALAYTHIHELLTQNETIDVTIAVFCITLLSSSFVKKAIS